MNADPNRYHTPDYIVRYVARQVGMEYERLRAVTV